MTHFVRPLVVDIETVPLAASMSAPYPEAERTPPGNYKNPEAIAKWRETDKVAWEAERAKTYSLNPRLGRVLCIGTTAGLFRADTEEDEPAALREFWRVADEADGRIVSWNGAWDLRFILLRTMAHRIVPTLPAKTISAWFRRYVHGPHYDCKAILSNWEPYKSGEGLDEWATFFGLPGKTDGISGADVWPLYQEGKLDTIAAYCAADVTATERVYECMAPYFGPVE